MPVADAETKTQRLLELQMLFWRNPQQGFRTPEIATYLGVSERTARNYLDELSTSGRLPIYKEGWEWKLMEDARMALLPVNLDLEQGTQLYLAARLLARHSDEPNPAIRAALVKLISAMPPTLSGHLERLAQNLPTQADPHYASVFRAVVYGWATHRVVDLEYHPLKARPYRARFCPYLLEPSAIGYTVYAIGHSDPPRDLRTYKLERIVRAELTEETFHPPADFDGLTLLQQAWGVMYGEELSTVILRFAPGIAARRVKETIWHPSQKIRDLEDGSVEWTAQVGDWLEMLPWVRGWGADVEVLAPEELREALVKEVRKMARIYGVSNEPPPPCYQLLWGKLSHDRTRSHPLICHLLDVAEMTRALWCEALTGGQRAQWAIALKLDEAAAGRLLAFWAGLHDLGKASVAFQRQWREAEPLLSAVGLPFPPRFVSEFCPHGWITTATLPSVLAAETGLSLRVAARMARALGGHHGAWPTPAEEQAVKSDERGGEEWDAVRRDLLRVLRDVLQPPALPSWPLSSAAENNAFLTWFSGLVSVADWLGSMENHFPYAEAPLDPTRYAQQAAAQAQAALQSWHWADWQPPADALPFAELFPFSPSPMQQAVVDLAHRLDRPALVLIEAPTGSGKTEAALYLADTWARTLQQRGLYVAMPTMATSNQMWQRVGEFLRRRYPQSDLKLLLVHSQARWVEPPPDVTLQDETEESAAAALAWFLPRKRSLLAACGVGTVDQGLMCVLQARHFFVRLFGLSAKSVVFDEIHAYDTYMSALFHRLLGWLRAMGASVVLLSATLPAQTRRELLEAYVGRSVDLPPAEYPAVTWATAEDVGVVQLPKPAGWSVALEWQSREPGAVVEALRSALRAGGCAAVICNTVGRAQEIYLALKEARLVPDDALTLFHARYPFAWRDEIETMVLACFGKNGTRPERAIVVATQVIEQSLDLDFDVMVSDLAPVDLLLQRAGRLHRHPGRTRPAPVADPRLYVAVDVSEGAVPDFGQDVYVYAPYFLLRSYIALRGCDALTLPDDVAALIEAGYGDEPLPNAPPALVAALDEARQEMQQDTDKDEYEARKRLVGKPTFDGLLNETSAGLEEDAPDVHAAFQALTRLGPPTIFLVCLHEAPTGLNTEPDGSGVHVDLARKPDAETTKALARATVGVSHRAVVDHFRAEGPPPGWRKHSLLRDHRVAVFVNGVHTCGSLALRLGRELGLQIESAAPNSKM
jgi:CRISPR-associated endonuclease/helicase Cas3